MKVLSRRDLDPTVAGFVSGAVRGAILSFAVIVALGKFGITIAPIIAAIGALAFGSTMAMQGVLSNLGGGISLLIFRPFRAGDTIEVAGVSGVVESVKLGATTLTDEDGVRITVPNRHIVGEVLRNSFGYRIVESSIGISYQDDPEQAIAALAATLGRFAEVAKTPAPTIGIQEFGDSAIVIGYRYWVPTKQVIQLSYAVNLAVFKALKEARLTIPFPQLDVHVAASNGADAVLPPRRPTPAA
jgi:small conductance mechanosensitive channel